jgi:hypothetical protein
MVSIISFPWIKADSAFLHLIGGLHYHSPLFPYPMSSGVPLLLTSVHLFLLFLLLLASLPAVASFVCAGILAFASPYCVGGSVVATIPAVPCFSAVVSGHDDAVILYVACCWSYCCCLCRCYCWHSDRGTHPCCCWCSLSS